jgi:hypothetical protein
MFKALEATRKSKNKQDPERYIIRGRLKDGHVMYASLLECPLPPPVHRHHQIAVLGRDRPMPPQKNLNQQSWDNLCARKELSTVGFTKKRISYDFNFYIGSTRHIPKTFRSAALSTARQPWWSADRPSERRHGFISLIPGNPKIPIGSKYHTWLIGPIRLPGNFHGGAPEFKFDFH